MNFALSEDQLLFKETMRKLFDQQEQTAIVRKMIAGDTEVTAHVYSKLAELGATAIAVPEQFDGLGLGSLDVMPVLEELGYSLYPSNYAETVAFAATIIGKFGQEQLQETYLPQIAAGEAIFSLAWLEEHKSYDSKRLESSLTKAATGYVLNAKKTLVQVLNTTHCIVVAQNEDGQQVLVVASLEDAHVTPLASFDVTTPVAICEWQNVAVGAAQVIEDAAAFAYGLEHLHVAISTLQVGAMDRLVEMTTDYAKIREQFGQPIGRFQSVKHRLADMKVQLEIARSLSYYASWALDNAAPDAVEAVYSARSYCTEALIHIAEESVQLHGGIGFTEELDCHLYVKRSKYYEHYLGSIYSYREKIAQALNIVARSEQDEHYIYARG